MRRQGPAQLALSRCSPVLFTAAFGAGLATGLLRFGSPLGATVLAFALALGGRAPGVLLAGAALTGRLSAELAWVAEHSRCAAVLPGERLRLQLRLEEPVDDAGGLTAVRPLGAGCAGTVLARWPRGQPLPAGSEATVTARWMSRAGPAGRAGGTLAVTQAEERRRNPSLPHRLRNYLHGASRDLYGVRAGMVDALVLGRRGGIPPELQDRFAWSGLVHLLSISGFHVGLITAWVVLLGRALGLTGTRSLIAGALVSAAYVAFLGWPAPATRAAALAGVLAWCRWRQRHVRAGPLLAATCLFVLLIDPWAMLDLGGWLSASALWGATTFSAWSDRVLGRRFVWRTLGSSVGATLATAPITAVALGTVAPVGVLVNFAAIPLAAIAVPGVIASLALRPLSEAVSGALAAGAGLTLHLLELSAVLGAALPWGHVLLDPGRPTAGLPWAIALGLGLWAIGRCNTGVETMRRLGWAGALVLWTGLLAGLAPVAGDGPRGLALHFLDVGQGDAAALRTPGGQWVLIDGGPASGRSDAGRRVVAPFLKRRGARRLTAVVVSHAHADHLGGVPAVLRTLPTGLVLEPGATFADPAYVAFLESLAEGDIAWHAGRAGECVRIDGVRFTILHPEPAWGRWGEDVNEDSLILLVEYGAFQAVFAGDAGLPAEDVVAARLATVDLLKVGHHGSRGSTGTHWLSTLRPTVAVISVGRNDYGHPAPVTLERLARHEVSVRRTDRDGTVSVLTDGVRMTVRSAHGSDTYELAGGDGPGPGDTILTQSGAACRHP